MTSTGSNAAVLIIDDDQNLCTSLKRILQHDGYVVDIATSSAAALRRENWDTYFAILLDRKLPEEVHVSLLSQLVEKAPDAVVLIITGHGDLDSSLEAIRLGAVDYLLKPIDPDHLRARLKTFAELKSSRDELRKRDEQIRFMIDHLPAGAAYVDFESGHVRVNRKVTEITGYPAEELANLDRWFAVLFKEQGQAYRVTYENERVTGMVQPHLVNITTKNGDSIVAEFSGYRYDHHEVWMISDVTERQRYERELKAQRDFADRILDTAQVIILVLDTAGNVVRFNKFMEELTGYTQWEMDGQNWFDRFIPSEEKEFMQRLFDRVVAGDNVSGHINPILTKSGAQRQIAWWGRPVTNSEGIVTGVLSIGHDITDLKTIQTKLVQQERLAAIGEMITGLAHESRNALQRARACLDMLSLDLVGQPGQLDLTKRVQAALDELQRLYEEVRGYAAPIQLSLRTCRLQDVWQTAWQHVTKDLGNESIGLHEQLNDLNTTCTIDHLKIEQVFRNLFENAVAVSPAGSKLQVSASDVQYDGEAAVSIKIRDCGTGISLVNADQIFEPFFTTKQKGTGLGLAICKRIMEAHHGAIRIAENSPTGLTIELILLRKAPIDD